MSHERFITCGGRTDGVGAQIHGMLSTMVFAEQQGYRYVHTPLSEVGHRPDGYMGDWEKDWEEFFNLGLDELSIQTFSGSPDALITTFHRHHEIDRNPDLYLPHKGRFLKKYLSHPKPRLGWFDAERLNVAVHMRRGDVRPEATCSLDGTPRLRYTSAEFMAATIARLRTVLSRAGRDALFHLFSEGPSTHLLTLLGADVVFHLDADPFDTFHHMVSADILVMAKSSFSYVAGLLSSGVVFSEDFWHRPLSHWIPIDQNGDFPSNDWVRRLPPGSRATEA